LKPFPAESEIGLCGLLGAELEVNTGNQEMVVRIAEGID
jgi:hypothetical protein